jgi:hypothetical protein
MPRIRSRRILGRTPGLAAVPARGRRVRRGRIGGRRIEDVGLEDVGLEDVGLEDVGLLPLVADELPV